MLDLLRSAHGLQSNLSYILLEDPNSYYKYIWLSRAALLLNSLHVCSYLESPLARCVPLITFRTLRASSPNGRWHFDK